MPEYGQTIPVSQIEDLKRQGMSNNDIIRTLQQQGYSSTQIFDALSPAAPSYAPRRDAPLSPMPAPARPDEDIEELVESIIDEKWNDLLADINKVIAWKDATESRIAKMEQQLSDMKTQFEKVHQAIIGKVAEYDQHILDVGAEVKAMEKVFSKVLPVFTDNVAELSRITDNMRKIPPKG